MNKGQETGGEVDRLQSEEQEQGNRGSIYARDRMNKKMEQDLEC